MNDKEDGADKDVMKGYVKKLDDTWTPLESDTGMISSRRRNSGESRLKEDLSMSYDKDNVNRTTEYG